MKIDEECRSALMGTLIGLAALASAMGVGRFAFTPLLPLMQEHAGLSLGEGAWLAGANYAGYLVGALACSVVAPAPRHAARLGLVAVALLTLAMGMTAEHAAWSILRFAAGVASAYVLVGVSAWALPMLAERDRSAWSGWVFAGVGVGISLAGLVGLIAGVGAHAPAGAWLVLGGISAVVAAIAWAPMRTADLIASSTAQPITRFDARAWRLISCYGSFGFGYIIPATFLPAVARELIADPAVFGWIWPAFGVTAAASTVIASLCFRRTSARTVWAMGQLVMAVGVLAPVLFLKVGTLLLAAVCVGGTFMVVTMAGMQEARRTAGAGAPRLMAAMTAAFALGQLAGPLAVGFAGSIGTDGIAGPSLLAATLLSAGAWALLKRNPVGAVPMPR